MSGAENNRYIVQVFVGALSQHYEALSVEASKQTTAEEIVSCIVERLSLSDGPGGGYELAEVIGDSMEQECKERRLGPLESPVALMLLWPKPKALQLQQEFYRFYLREKLSDILWTRSFTMDPQLIKDYFYRFIYQPKDREYPDLCQLPDLNEQTLLDNLRARFSAGHIYTYVGSILIAVNPFKFHPIYNPKYVKLYQNRRLGSELPPHIFAVADTAYHCMLKERRNQCIVISGESGSGKTESTNFLLHHLTALSQKGCHGSGVEQTILSAGPVLEAFGNAKTAHNNNSSRFGKFIQVNYKENGMVHGAVVQKYLLEKSRICSQGRNERNYHVFYYLLAGASHSEKELLHLRCTDDYYYLSKSGCFVLDHVDEKYEFSRLKQSMEMVGFTAEKQRRLFAVLSAVLLLGNVEFQPRKSAYHHDEAVAVRNPEVVQLISELLRVKQETLLAALTAKRARASGETLIINYRLPEAIAARDAMAKCLYGALFDWIVLQVNHALLSKKDTLRDHQGNSIGVLDIFGFEDFGLCNSFEQFCINYANEHLQYYFNQHVFKYEQEEYRKEGIRWTDIDFMDNTQCLQLIEGKPSGLLCMLDDQCNFPGATNETLLQKFNSVHKDSNFYEIPQRREAAFIVRHYAGKVKYQVAEMREKNLDLMRQDIVGVLKNSSMAFVRELVGADPVAVFRWAIVRAFFRGYFAFHEAGRKHRQGREGSKSNAVQNRYRKPNDNLISTSTKVSGSVYSSSRLPCNYQKQRITNESQSGQLSNNRLSWPQFNHRNNTTNPLQQTNESETSSSRTTNVLETNTRGSARRQPGPLERVMCPNEAKVMERANQIVMKNKSFRPRERGKKGLKNLQTVKTLAGRTQSYGCAPQQIGKARKQPLTVSAQFQHSLHSLMDTLNQANPFFIRCIKSNSDKISNKFDEDTVQRQLRYTGMLETVRIRQAGYNVRLTYDEFIQHYRILLPKGLVSSQADVRDFLLTLNLNRDNYQLGTSKIFFRESEKVKLDYRLHQQIIASIVTIQRWSRAILERRRFLKLKDAVVYIQACWRMVVAQRLLGRMRAQLMAAVQIQAAWRGHSVYTWYKKLKASIITFQAQFRGNLARTRFREAKRKRAEDQQVQWEAAHVGSLLRDSALQSVESSDVHDRLFTGYPYYEDVGSRHSPMVEVKHSKKLVLKKSKVSKTEQDSYQEEKVSGIMVMSERKGSSDSLASLKSIESQRSSDSQSSVSVRDTIHKAKKHIQALIGVSKKSERCDIGSVTQSDGELDDIGSPTPKSTAPYTNSNTPPILLDRMGEALHGIAPALSSLDGREGSSYKTPALLDRRDDSSYKTPSLLDRREDILHKTPTLPDRSEDSSHKTSALMDRREHSLHRIAALQDRREDSSHRAMHMLPPVDSSHRNSQPPDRIRDILRQGPSHPEYEDQKDGANRTDPEVWRRQLDPESIVKRPITRSANVSSQHPVLHSVVRHPLKASISHDSPEVPVRLSRRARPAREQCRSVGEELITHTMVDSTTNLGTIRESGGLLLEPRRGRDRCSSPGTDWLDTPPQLPIHVVATKRARSGGITSLDLKRRNSDPATTKCLVAHHPAGTESPSSKGADPQWKDWKEGVFHIAGHRFRKLTRFSKDDRCVYCDKPMDAIVTQGHKCSDCKQLFHTKCIQNGGVKEMPCQQHQGPSGGKPGRRKHRKHSRSPYDMNKPSAGSKFSLTGTSEFTDRTDEIISDAHELQLMQDFITKKIYKIESEEGKKPSEVDRVFQQALREFKDNLVATYSVMNKQGADSFNIKYKDLIANFIYAMQTVCTKEQTREDFPVTMGVNAFRGFMNEFMSLTRLEEKPNKTKRKKEKKRKVDEPIVFAGHTFLLTIINIPTACEICTSFFMWPIERGLVCQNCKLTCHKKCHSKVMVTCGKEGLAGNMPGGPRIFGVPLHRLVVGDGKVPAVVDRLITTIEMYGLYTEGLYRKSGVSSKIKELKARMEEVNMDSVNFENYPVHVLAAVLKSFLREMPEPLLTFDSYDDFLRAGNLTDPQDRISTLFAILKKLPKPNFDLMERLIFHLARVALHEDANRMNSSALAIVFAPCVLRTNKIVPAQDSLHDISRQTQCIETIVTEQLRKVKATLADIDTLDTACHTATHRLSSLRSSKIFSPEELQAVEMASNDSKMNPDDEEALLMGHIEEIQKEKELLTSALPSLTRTTSDDDLLSTDMDDGSVDDDGDHERGLTHGQRIRSAGHRSLVSRSLSGGSGEPGGEDMGNRSGYPPRYSRQSSSDTSVVSRYPPFDVDTDEDPIMV